MPTSPRRPAPYAGPVTLYREEAAIVFLGDDGWSHQVPLDQVATDAALAQVIDVLRAQPWLDAALEEQFRVEVLWLRQQLPPGK